MMIAITNLMVLLKQMKHFFNIVKKKQDKLKEEMQEKEVIVLTLIQRKLKYVSLLLLIEIKHHLQNLSVLEV